MYRYDIRKLLVQLDGLAPSNLLVAASLTRNASSPSEAPRTLHKRGLSTTTSSTTVRARAALSVIVADATHYPTPGDQTAKTKSSTLLPPGCEHIHGSLPGWFVFFKSSPCLRSENCSSFMTARNVGCLHPPIRHARRPLALEGHLARSAFP